MRWFIDLLKRLKHPKLGIVDIFKYSVLHDLLGRSVVLQPKGFRFPIGIRSGSWDINIFKQIFVDREYDVKIAGPVKTIIDAGANVGMATLYFADRFPEATIISIEPEAGNFEALSRVCSLSEKLIPVRGGLWSRSGHLRIINPGHASIGFRVDDVGTAAFDTLPAYTVDGLMGEYGIDELDILKIDIEGAEQEVFSKDISAWITKVRIIIIELHDFISPGTAEAVFSNVQKMGHYQLEMRGENMVFTRL